MCGACARAQVAAHKDAYLGASLLWRETGLPRSGVQGIGSLALLNATHQSLEELVYGREVVAAEREAAKLIQGAWS